MAEFRAKCDRTTRSPLVRRGLGSEAGMGWQPELEELRERERLAAELGGVDKIERQHQGGRLTVRERIDGLADPGSFHEVGAIAGHAESVVRS